jgi:4-hydroxy-tetrahydrodipicolinate reductase
MGQTVAKFAANSEDMQVCAGIDKMPDLIANDFPVYTDIFDCRETANVIIDFSRPDALDANLRYALSHDIPIVIATTGFSDDEKARIENAAERVPVFFTANMSLGVNLQMELARKAATFLGEDCDIEIVEKHHNQKVDSPSGTAFAIAEAINDALMAQRPLVCGRCTRTEKRGREIGIHAVRGGTIPGEHSVYFIGTDEIIEIKHTAQSRQIFALGALRAAAFVCGMPSGLYNMNDILSQSAVTSVYKDDGQAVVSLSELTFSPEAIANVFSDIANAGIKIDIISQTMPRNGKASLSFSLPRADMKSCMKAIAKYKKECEEIVETTSLSKLTVEGAGMQQQTGVAAKLFGALAGKNIGIAIITTSETNISFCVETSKAVDAISVVAEAFCL